MCVNDWLPSLSMNRAVLMCVKGRNMCEWSERLDKRYISQFSIYIVAFQVQFLILGFYFSVN